VIGADIAYSWPVAQVARSLQYANVQQAAWVLTSLVGEFGYELMLLMPHVYYFHESGSLSHTWGASGTQELYYFSAVYEEKGCRV
jgi:hypothetical protein